MLAPTRVRHRITREFGIHDLESTRRIGELRSVLALLHESFLSIRAFNLF